MNNIMSEGEVKITKEEAYQAMMHFMFHYFKEVGFSEEDVLSWAAYNEKTNKPLDMGYKYKWDDIVKGVINGKPPLRYNPISHSYIK